MRDRLQALDKLEEYGDWAELDWRSSDAELAALQDEKQRLEAASDVLRALATQLATLEAAAARTAEQLKAREAEQAQTQLKQSLAQALREQVQTLLDAPAFAGHAQHFGMIEGWRAEALGEHILSVESCDGRAQDMRQWLQGCIDADDRKLARLTEKIVRLMSEYRRVSS